MIGRANLTLGSKVEKETLPTQNPDAIKLEFLLQ